MAIERPAPSVSVQGAAAAHQWADQRTRAEDPCGHRWLSWLAVIRCRDGQFAISRNPFLRPWPRTRLRVLRHLQLVRRYHRLPWHCRKGKSALPDVGCRPTSTKFNRQTKVLRCSRRALRDALKREGSEERSSTLPLDSCPRSRWQVRSAATQGGTQSNSVGPGNTAGKSHARSASASASAARSSGCCRCEA